MSDQQQPTPEGGPAPVEAPKSDPVRITPDGVANRPSLRAKAVNERPTDTVVPEDAPELGEPVVGPRKPVRKVTLPSQSEIDSRLTYATHRPPPESKAAKPAAQKAAARPSRPQASSAKPAAKTPEKEISAGFVLGIVIFVLTVVFGFALIRMDKRMDALERRVPAMNVDETPAGE